MKKYIVLFCMILTGYVMVVNPVNMRAEEITEVIDLRSLPDFTFHTLDGQLFGRDNLIKGKKVMMVYFHPLCDICQRETEEIIDNIGFFKDVEILMVSPANEDDVKKFYDQYRLKNFSQIKVLLDKDDIFYKLFDAKAYPSLYLFNESYDLIGTFETETDFTDIRKVFDPGTASGKKRQK